MFFFHWLYELQHEPVIRHENYDDDNIGDDGILNRGMKILFCGMVLRRDL
jgi:hypothetical protein